MPKQPRELGGMREYAIPCMVEVRATVYVNARNKTEAESKFLFKKFDLEDFEIMRWWKANRASKEKTKLCDDCQVPMTRFSCVSSGLQCELCGRTERDEK